MHCTTEVLQLWMFVGAPCLAEENEGEREKERMKQSYRCVHLGTYSGLWLLGTRVFLPRAVVSCSNVICHPARRASEQVSEQEPVPYCLAVMAYIQGRIMSRSNHVFFDLRLSFLTLNNKVKH